MGADIIRAVVLEHAIICISPGREAQFEAAFAQAEPLIRCQPGFLALSLSRSLESTSCYLLLVEWDAVESHTQGFRGSAEYREWKRLLHGFYAPFPEVEHFVAVRPRRA